MMRVSTKERARGHWRFILPKLGIASRYLSGRNCPCPLCGGRDRFRYLDRRGCNGDGMWVCNQCTPHPRPAIDLVMKFTDKPFKDAAREVDVILNGGNIVRYKPRFRWWDDNKVPPPNPYAKKVWSRSVCVERGDVVDRYLRSRGVGMDVYPNCLRISDDEPYIDDHGEVFRHPAMIALICRADGKPVAVHRTYLAPDGLSKAPVAKPRKAVGRFGPSPTTRLASPGPTLGIAEGTETSLSAMKLFKVPTWSVLSTYGIETFEPPAGVEKLIIFADRDSNGAGQRAAEKLVERLTGKISVEVRVPPQPGTDWNDVLRTTRSEEQAT
jgi:putative DNA primase/helicase